MCQIINCFSESPDIVEKHVRREEYPWWRMHHVNSCKTYHQQADVSQQKLRKTTNKQVMIEEVIFFFNLTSFLQFFSQHPLEESVLENLSPTKCEMPHWCQENKAQFKEALRVIPSEFLLSARSTSLHKNDKAQDYA